MTTANGASATAEKDLPEDAIKRSVIAPQTTVQQTPGQIENMALGENTALFFMASKGDGIVPWGYAPSARDKQLRAIIGMDPFSLSAIATCIATNMGLGYELKGPDGAVANVQDVLHASQFGEGWEVWTAKTGWDYYQQDKGSVSEIVRQDDDPRSPTIGLNQLDIQRSWHTGNPEIPVLYQDRLGRWHGLKYYNCLRLNEMPAPHELLYGLQYSAATRILGISRIIRNMLTLLEEKTGGRHTRTVHIVSGIKKGDIENAMRIAQAEADRQNLSRYIQPVIVPTLDPNQEAKIATLALADLPERFSENMDTYFKWFLVAISMGLLRDYQDFAPLPGGGLGTSQQSDVLHQKSRGKGPAIWKRRVSHAFNFNGVMPRNVEFSYDEADVEEEKAEADKALVLAQAVQVLTSDFILDPKGARQWLVDKHVISQEMFDALEARDITGQSPLGDNDRLVARTVYPTEPAPNGPPPQPAQQPGGQPPPRTRGGPPAPSSIPDNNPQNRNAGRTVTGERDMTIEIDDDRLNVEGQLSSAGERALEQMGREVRRRLNRSVHAGVDVP